MLAYEISVSWLPAANKKKTAHISDITETITNMRETRLKLNLEKCVWGNKAENT
jgi:hypothetical protein